MERVEERMEMEMEDCFTLLLIDVVCSCSGSSAPSAQSQGKSDASEKPRNEGLEGSCRLTGCWEKREIALEYLELYHYFPLFRSV